MAKKQTQPEISPLDQEKLAIGHLIKYNLYLLSKSIVFAALSQNIKDPKKAAEKANEIINELDLDTKRRLEQQQQ